MEKFNSADYERMMVEAAGGLPSAKPVVQIDKAAPGAERSFVVVQNDFSFRNSFIDILVRRGALVRVVG